MTYAVVCCSPATYLFHMEVINLLVAFCSTQLYTAHATAYPGAHPFTEVLMKPPFNGCDTEDKFHDSSDTD